MFCESVSLAAERQCRCLSVVPRSNVVSLRFCWEDLNRTECRILSGSFEMNAIETTPCESRVIIVEVTADSSVALTGVGKLHYICGFWFA